MDVRQLSKLGLTEAEATIYFSVLKLGICTVKQISKECGFHRTNIYDVLEQLKERGLIGFFKEGKTTKYQASNPENLYEILRERKEILDMIFPEIQRFYKESYEPVQVEIYKGSEGMKAAFRDMIRENVPLFAFGVRGQLREKLPIFAQQWLRDAKNKKIKYYGIYTKRGDVPSYFTEIRYVPEGLGVPVATFIYGDKININIWEPTLVAIIIKSRLVAQTYKNHFDLLWKIAKK